MLLQHGELRDRVVRLMGVREIGRSRQALDEAGSDLAHFFLRLGWKKMGLLNICEVAIPTLRLASDDRARAALSAEQIEKLKNSLADYMGEIREALDFKREQLGPEKSEPLEKTGTTVVIAGRGPIDQAAAELVADAIRFELKMAVQCPSPGGLTGISTVAAAVRDAPIEVVALISVGEVTIAN